MKASLYYRVSTKDKQEIDMQVKAVRDYCARENIEIYKEYSDRGVSGSKESRPEFDLMLQDMRAGLFDTIIVYRLDRIGRSLSHLVKLFEEFRKKDIKFISVTQSFNTITPEGKLMLGMLMLLAEYERNVTISRVNDGLAEAKAKGKILGRPKGSTDKKRRTRSGYYLRWGKKTTPQKIKVLQHTEKPQTENKITGNYLQ
jgi:DNA invertase Pin-like site-specific DNA recombinase